MAEPAMTDKSWGRVADDGTVYVRDGDTERPVGSWFAGSPEDGLAYYRRRYDALVVDVDLLAHRLTEGQLGPDEAMAKIGRLRQHVDEPQCVGDLHLLRARLDGLVDVVQQRRAERAAQRDAERASARAAREALVTEAERLSTSTRWKATNDRFRALVEEWKSAAHTDRATDQQLWRRLSAARATFDKRRRTHVTEAEQQREAAAVTKEQLVKEAQALSQSRDWGATAKRYRDLMQQWKNAGAAPRSQERQLWEAFRAASDAFYSARSAAFQERDAEYSRNLERKLTVLREAEALLPVTNPREARQQLRTLQERFAEAGKVSRLEKDAVDARMQAVEHAVRGAEDARWRASNPEARARAQTTAEQLRTSLARLRAELAAAQESGDEAAVTRAREAIDAREGWLGQAEQTVREFGG